MQTYTGPSLTGTLIFEPTRGLGGVCTWTAPQQAYSAASVCAGALQYDVWLWNMPSIHGFCFSTIYSLFKEKKKSPHLKVMENRVIFGSGWILWWRTSFFHPPHLLLHRLTLVKLGVRHSQHLFIELLWWVQWQLMFAVVICREPPDTSTSLLSHWCGWEDRAVSLNIHVRRECLCPERTLDQNHS